MRNRNHPERERLKGFTPKELDDEVLYLTEDINSMDECLNLNAHFSEEETLKTIRALRFKVSCRNEVKTEIKIRSAPIAGQTVISKRGMKPLKKVENLLKQSAQRVAALEKTVKILKGRDNSQNELVARLRSLITVDEFNMAVIGLNDNEGGENNEKLR